MELASEIIQEVDTMISALESAKTELEKKFKNVLGDYIDKAFEDFYNVIEWDTRYNFNAWISRVCNDIIEGLLAGDTKWLKHTRVISEYSWDRLQAVRIACWNAAGGEVANSLIAALVKENEELKKKLESMMS